MGDYWTTDRTADNGTTGSARALTAGLLMAGWVALLWILEGIDTASGHALDTYGISPRELSELRDVVPAAFLHSGWEHVASNSVPLLVLGFITALAGLRRFAAVVVTIILASGLGVWLTAPANTITLGASGVVFGLLGYLLVRGFVDHAALGRPHRRRRRRGLRLAALGRPAHPVGRQLAGAPVRADRRCGGGVPLPCGRPRVEARTTWSRSERRFYGCKADRPATASGRATADPAARRRTARCR